MKRIPLFLFIFSFGMYAQHLLSPRTFNEGKWFHFVNKVAAFHGKLIGCKMNGTQVECEPGTQQFDTKAWTELAWESKQVFGE